MVHFVNFIRFKLEWHNSKECMCCLQIIAAMYHYQESVTTTKSVTTGQMDGQTPDKVKVIPMCRYASQATQLDVSVK